jgi:hypothetical protein
VLDQWGCPYVQHGTVPGAIKKICQQKSRLAIIYDEADSSMREWIEKPNGSHASTLNTLDDGSRFRKTLVSGETETGEATRVFLASQPELLTQASNSRVAAIRQSEIIGFPYRFMHIYPDTKWVTCPPDHDPSEAKNMFISLAEKLRVIVGACGGQLIFTGAASQNLRQFEQMMVEIQNSALKYSPDYVRLLSPLSKCQRLAKMMTGALHLLSFLDLNTDPDAAAVRSIVDPHLMRSATEWIQHGYPAGMLCPQNRGPLLFSNSCLTRKRRPETTKHRRLDGLT